MSFGILYKPPDVDPFEVLHRPFYLCVGFWISPFLSCANTYKIYHFLPAKIKKVTRAKLWRDISMKMVEKVNRKWRQDELSCICSEASFVCQRYEKVRDTRHNQHVGWKAFVQTWGFKGHGVPWYWEHWKSGSSCFPHLIANVILNVITWED